MTSSPARSSCGTEVHRSKRARRFCFPWRLGGVSLVAEKEFCPTMKRSTRYLLYPLAIGTILACAVPAFADDSDSTSQLKKAKDMVKQAWNPGDTAPAAND